MTVGKQDIDLGIAAAGVDACHRALAEALMQDLATLMQLLGDMDIEITFCRGRCGGVAQGVCVGFLVVSFRGGASSPARRVVCVA